MAKPKTESSRRNFESPKKNDTFIAICNLMLESAVYKSLTPRQQMLYIYCRNEERHPKRYKPDKNDLTQFYFNEAIWSDKIDPTTGRQGYCLYSTNHAMHFYRDMDALIEKGFIRCIYRGSKNRQRNIYQYSDKWQLYGTVNFEVMQNEMTSSLLNKHNKQIDKPKSPSKEEENQVKNEGVTQIDIPDGKQNMIVINEDEVDTTDWTNRIRSKKNN